MTLLGDQFFYPLTFTFGFASARVRPRGRPTPPPLSRLRRASHRAWSCPLYLPLATSRQPPRCYPNRRHVRPCGMRALVLHLRNPRIRIDRAPTPCSTCISSACGHAVLALRVSESRSPKTFANRGASAAERDGGDGNQTRVAAMRVLTCGSLSIPQRRRSRLSMRSALMYFCAIRRNFSSISTSVIGFLKCPR